MKLERFTEAIKAFNEALSSSAKSSKIDADKRKKFTSETDKWLKMAKNSVKSEQPPNMNGRLNECFSCTNGLQMDKSWPARLMQSCEDK